jgi:transcription factor 1
MLALAAEVTEVAGVDLADKTANKPTRDNKTLTSQPRIRNSAINAENNLQVKQRMNLAGMAVPAGRKLLRHSEGRDGELKDPFIIRYHSVEEISKAIDEFDTFLDTIRAVANQGWSRLHITSGTSGLEGLVAGIEYPQCIPAAVENAPSPMSATQRNEDGITAPVQRKAIYLDITLRMINLETHVVVLREKGVDIEDLKARLFKLDKEIQEELMPGLPEMCHTIVEDQILHFTTPQICMYDRRKCEPLRAAHDDFWPKSGLALYDCMPSSRDLDVWDIAQRPEVVQLTRELSKLLFGRKASSISTALDHCATNAAQDLIPKVPALTDPRKGGRLNPNNMLTRMISEEAFEGLVKAWFEWPFKPDRYDLEVSALGKKQFMGPIDGNTEASGKSVKSKKGSGRRRKSVAA